MCGIWRLLMRLYLSGDCSHLCGGGGSNQRMDRMRMLTIVVGMRPDIVVGYCPGIMVGNRPGIVVGNCPGVRMGCGKM
jgi:hypothetical protein